MIRHYGRFSAALTVGILVSAGASPSATAAGYTIKDLGVFSGGYRSYAQGINSLGHAVGQADVRRVYHAFLYKDNQLLDLGTLGGSNSYARGVNDVGQVVGYSLLRSGVYRAFMYRSNRMIDLGTLGGNASYAHAINNASAVQVAGSSYVAGDAAQHAFRWTDTNSNGRPDSGEMKDLGTLGGKHSTAYGIDGAGRVVGEAHAVATYTDSVGNTITFDVGPHAFLWADQNTNGVSDPGEMQDLGTLPGGDMSCGYSINSLGQVVGYSNTSFGSTPFVWDSVQGMRDLIDRTDMTGPFSGSPRGAALSINNLGESVGWADNINGVRLAFLHKNGVMTDLNTLLPPNSGWRLFQATAINGSGQIVGYGTLNGGTAYPHAFLMTPTP